MANKENGFVRWVRLKFDRAAGRRMEQEAEESLERAGKLGGEELQKQLDAGGAKAARALASSLQREYRIRIAKAKRELAEETIDQAEFRRVGQEAAKEFNAGYSRGLKELQAKSKLTELQLANASSRFKSVSAESGAGGGLLAGVVGKATAAVGGYFALSTIFSAAEKGIEASDQLQASVRKLGGAAAVSGTDLGLLQEQSKALQEQFKLSVPFANDLVGSMNKLTARAGDASRTQAALSAWLDLAAANGLGASEAMDALNTTIIGQDEGLNRLGLANPQQIYQKWAEKAGLSAAKMTDAQKAQAILDAVTEAGSKVQGQYGEYLKSNAGAADQQAQRIQTLAARTGEALQPLRTFAGFLKETLYANLLVVTKILGGFIGAWEKLIEFGKQPLTVKINLIRYLWDGSVPGGTALDYETPRKRMEAFLERARAGKTVDALGNPFRTPAQRAADAAAAQKAAAEKAAADKKAAEEKRQADAKTADTAAAASAARVKAMWDHLDQYIGSEENYNQRTTVRSFAPDAPGIIRSVRAGVYPARTEPTKAQDLFGVLFGSSKEQWESDADEAAYNIASSFQDAFERMREDGATLNNFMQGIFRGMAGFALAGIASFAEGKAKENFAAAIEKGAEALGFAAHGNAPAAALAWKSAAEHVAAGVAWGALAGGAGAARGGVTGGAGAIPQNTRDAGLNTFDQATLQQPAVYVYVNPLDKSNPAAVKQLGKMLDVHVELSNPEWAKRRA